MQTNPQRSHLDHLKAIANVDEIQIEEMTTEFKEELSRMETGSVALVYSDPNSDLTVEVMVVMVMTTDYLTQWR